MREDEADWSKALGVSGSAFDARNYSISRKVSSSVEIFEGRYFSLLLVETVSTILSKASGAHNCTIHHRAGLSEKTCHDPTSPVPTED